VTDNIQDGTSSAGGHSHGGMGGMSASGLAMDPDGTPFSNIFRGGICADCTVLAAQVDIVHENGTRADIADGVYLHHMLTMLTSSKMPSEKPWVTMCPGNGIAKTLTSMFGDVSVPQVSFVGGAVDEFVDYFTDAKGKINAGFYIPSDTSGGLYTGEIINYLRSEQKVYIRLDLEWVPGRQGAIAMKTPLNVEGCDFTHSSFKKATGKGKIVSEQYDVKRSGTVVCARKSKSSYQVSPCWQVTISYDQQGLTCMTVVLASPPMLTETWSATQRPLTVWKVDVPLLMERNGRPFLR
jgi:hypothetical protein